MASFMSLEGEKVYLNPVQEKDIPLLAAFMNDDHIKIFGRNSGSAVYEKKMRDRLDESQKNESYAIFKKDGDELIGDIGLSFIDLYNRSAMLGVMVHGERNRGEGYGTEAILLFLKHAFIDLNLESLWLGTWDYNAGAMRVYERIGFKPIGRRRKARVVGDRRYDEIMMDMISEEYFERYGKAELGRYGI
jgi:RimJ/RimL family protein N-acetyltransferase